MGIYHRAFTLIIADASTCQLKLVHFSEEDGEISSCYYAIDLHPSLYHGDIQRTLFLGITDSHQQYLPAYALHVTTTFPLLEKTMELDSSLLEYKTCFPTKAMDSLEQIYLISR
ncbi:hypothetical protein H8959_018729 [Pygathrix nigripes]